jgi:hypothetical protein
MHRKTDKKREQGEHAMAETKRDRTIDRRGFLRTAGAGATVAAAAVAPALVASEAEALKVSADEARSRYRESEHVKAYYRVNRY